MHWKAAILSIKLKHFLTYMQSFASIYSKICLTELYIFTDRNWTKITTDIF